MLIMKEVGESVETTNRFYSHDVIIIIVAFTQFDYDTVIELSTAWADALRCVKEFISLALGVTKTDMYFRIESGN